MKLVTFDAGSERRIGAVCDDGVALVDLSAAFPDMLALIDAGDAGFERAAAMLRDRTLPCLPCDSYHGPVETCKNAAAALTCLLRWTTDEVERACRQWLDRWATPRTH